MKVCLLTTMHFFLRPFFSVWHWYTLHHVQPCFVTSSANAAASFFFFYTAATSIMSFSYYTCYVQYGAGIAQSVQRLAMGLAVRGSNPGGGGTKFSASVQTCPGAQPASYTMGTGSFLRVKRPGRGADHPPPSRAEVEGRVELYLYSPSGPSWPVLGRPLPLRTVFLENSHLYFLY